MLALSLLLAGEALPASASGTLSGGVRQDVLAPVTAAAGVVTDTEGRPIAGARVDFPDAGLQTVSDPSGRFALPGGLDRSSPQRGMIVAIGKPGYQQGWGVWQPGGGPFRLTLQRQGMAHVLDTNLHHLGDNSFSPFSAGAGQFRRRAEGPVLTVHFSGPENFYGRGAVLEIGALIGLDTRQAQAAGQSRLGFASSALRVSINGQPVAQVHLNGSNIRLPVPPGVLRPGGNILEIRAGSHWPGDYEDFDDLELMGLVLRPPG